MATTPLIKGKTFRPDINILFVDENPLLRRNLKIQFKSSGYTNLFFAESLRRALHMLDKNPINLIISDMGTTQAIGLQLLIQTRKNPASKNTPFLMMMREPDSVTIKTSLEAGANGFLAKPISFNTLEQEMTRVMTSD